jgi:predicted MFS family arabinose efflux permease
MLVSLHGYSLGVMIGPLEQEFGWSRAEISAGFFIIAFIALVMAPLVGICVDRFGPRRIALFGVAFFCAALAFLSTATSDIWSWWLRWALLGVASMFILPTVWTTAINHVFARNRGKALAIALCGTGLGAAIAPALTNMLVETYGWRGAYVGLALVGLIITLPPVLFLFRRPTDRRGRGESAPARAVIPSGYSVREGLRSSGFLKLAAAATVFGISICALSTNCVPVLLGQGFDRAAAAQIAGLLGIGSIIGRLGGGYLLDRLDAKKVAACSVLAPVVTVSIFLALPGQSGAASLACFVLGLAVGTELDACAYLAARHLGMRSFGTLFGVINGLLLFGNGLAPILSNHVYDVVGSYTPVLWALIPGFLLSGLLFLLLGRYPHFGEATDEISSVPEAFGQPAALTGSAG